MFGVVVYEHVIGDGKDVTINVYCRRNDHLHTQRKFKKFVLVNDES